MKSIRIIAVIVSALFILSFTANADAQNKKNDKKSAEITFVVWIAPTARRRWMPNFRLRKA